MIDLHTHTRESDGEKTPEELIDFAISKNIDAIAITDHDTADGIESAIKYARDKKIIFIPGIELDAKVPKGQMHILGLCINPNQEDFSQKLASIKKEREDRNSRFIEEFNKMGFEITLEELQKVSSGKVIGKPHFAKVFLKKGYIQTNDEMYDKYFKQPPLCNIKKSTLSGEEIIKLIKKAGGIAILAHPQNLKLSDSELVDKIAELKSYGLDGLECYHSNQTPEQMKRFREIAEQFNLLVTKGSDYHGPSIKPKIEIGTGINRNIVSDCDKDIIKKLLNYYAIQNERKTIVEER